MRDAFADAVYDLAKQVEAVFVLVADISPAGAMEKFRAEFPNQFINVGIAEQAMIGLAAGMAQRGVTVFCYTIATFALFRPYEFIRCDLAYQNLPVTIVGMGAGLSYSTLGGTHQAIDDVAAALAIPNVTVLAPADPYEVRECVRWCGARTAGGPVYLRLGKAGEPDLPATKRAGVFPHDVCLRYAHGGGARRLIISYGPIAGEAIAAARHLQADVVTVTSVGPELGRLRRVARRYAEVVVVEEASGGPLATLLRAADLGCETRVVSSALPREFVHAHGSRGELLEAAGLTAEKIVARLA